MNEGEKKNAKGQFVKGTKPARPFSSTYQPAYNPGRRPLLKNLPKDAREEVEKALWHALTLADQRTAQDYLLRTAETLPKYGYLVQVYAKGLMGRNGPAVAEQILDRLFGKPKQAVDLTGSTTERIVVVENQEQADKLKNIADLG